MLRTIIMQNSRLIHACFPIRIDEVWIDRFCVGYDWWRRLQPTPSLSSVCISSLWIGPLESNYQALFGDLSFTVYPKNYAHGFVVLCFIVVMQSFIMNSHEVFIHIHQGCFAGTGAIVRLPQCQWSKPDGYGKISQCITTTKHSKAKTVCIILGIYCTPPAVLVLKQYAFYLLAAEKKWLSNTWPETYYNKICGVSL